MSKGLFFIYLNILDQDGVSRCWVTSNWTYTKAKYTLCWNQKDWQEVRDIFNHIKIQSDNTKYERNRPNNS